MSLAILFHFVCAQHVSDINIHHQDLATVLLNYEICPVKAKDLALVYIYGV